MKVKLMNLLLIFFYLSFNSFAINLNIDGEVQEYPLSYFETNYINLNCNEDITIQLPKNSNNILFNNVSSNNKSFFINDCLNENIIEYNLEIFEDIGNNEYRFERNFNNYNNINYTYNLKIPMELQLNKSKSIPKNIKIEFSNSEQILKLNSSEIFVLYFNEIPEEDDEFSILHIIEEILEPSVILLSFISFLIGCILMFIYMNKKIKNNLHINVPSYVLSKEDRDILTIIEKNIGINQKQISIKMNFSKSRISAIISELESKKLIRREKFGRSYKVFINKKII